MICVSDYLSYDHLEDAKGATMQGGALTHTQNKVWIKENGVCNYDSHCRAKHVKRSFSRRRKADIFFGGGNKVIDKESTAFATALQEAMSPRAMELTRGQVRQTHADHT